MTPLLWVLRVALPVGVILIAYGEGLAAQLSLAQAARVVDEPTSHDWAITLGALIVSTATLILTGLSMRRLSQSDLRQELAQSHAQMKEELNKREDELRRITRELEDSREEKTQLMQQNIELHVRHSHLREAMQELENKLHGNSTC